MPPLAHPPPSPGHLANLFPLPPKRTSASPASSSQAPQLPPIHSPPFLNIDTAFPFATADVVDKTATPSKRGSMAYGAETGSASPTGVSFSTRRPRFSTLPSNQAASVGRASSRSRRDSLDTPAGPSMGHASELGGRADMDTSEGNVPPPIPPRPGRKRSAEPEPLPSSAIDKSCAVPPSKTSANEALGLAEHGEPLSEEKDADGDVSMDGPAAQGRMAEASAPPLPPRAGRGKRMALEPTRTNQDFAMPSDGAGLSGAGPARPALAESIPGVSQAGSSATGSSRTRRPLPPRPHPPAVSRLLNLPPATADVHLLPT